MWKPQNPPFYRDVWGMTTLPCGKSCHLPCGFIKNHVTSWDRFILGNQEISALYLMRKGDPTHFHWLNICKGGICLSSRNALLRQSSIVIIFLWESPKFPNYPFPLETFPPVLCRAKHEKQYVQTILPYQTQTYPPQTCIIQDSLRKCSLKLIEKHIQHVIYQGRFLEKQW